MYSAKHTVHHNVCVVWSIEMLAARRASRQHIELGEAQARRSGRKSRLCHIHQQRAHSSQDQPPQMLANGATGRISHSFSRRTASAGKDNGEKGRELLDHLAGQGRTRVNRSTVNTLKGSGHQRFHTCFVWPSCMWFCSQSLVLRFVGQD